MPPETDVLAVSIASILVIIVVVVLLFRFLLFCEEIGVKIFHRVIPTEERDVPRTYNNQQKQTLMELCGSRCEGTGIVLRCRYRGDDLQGDHWYPHARGGATNLKNLVMLCPKCNRRKTHHVPTFLQTRALRRRRRKYVKQESPFAAPGHWQSREDAKARSRRSSNSLNDFSF